MGSNNMSTPTKIRVTCSSIDGFSKSRSFKTLRGARKFATDYGGDTPEISERYNYAVSPSGVNRVTADVPIATLFPMLSDPVHICFNNMSDDV